MIDNDAMSAEESEDHSTWEQNLRRQIFDEYKRCTLSLLNSPNGDPDAAYKTFRDFFKALHKAVFYSIHDNEAKKYDEETLAINIAKLKAIADLRDCRGGAIL